MRFAIDFVLWKGSLHVCTMNYVCVSACAYNFCFQRLGPHLRIFANNLIILLHSAGVSSVSRFELERTQNIVKLG